MKNLALKNIEFDTFNSIKEDEDNDDNDEDYTSNLLNDNKAINDDSE